MKRGLRISGVRAYGYGVSPKPCERDAVTRVEHA